MKRIFFGFFMALLLFLVACDVGSQSFVGQSSGKPVQYFVTVAPPKVMPNEGFTIQGFVRNNGDSDMKNWNLKLFGLSTDVVNVDGDNILNNVQVQKNINPDMISQEFSKKLNVTKTVYNPMKYSFYLQSSFGYETKATTWFCYSLADPTCSGNVKEHRVSAGYLQISQPTVELLIDTNEYMKYKVSYTIINPYSDVRLSPLTITVNLNGWNNVEATFIGKTVEKKESRHSHTINSFELLDNKMTVDFILTIQKSSIGVTDKLNTITFNISYTVTEYLPVSVEIIPKQ
ncbi:MAG: hypothetical protein QXD62_01475 [Candidatus Woesearchaeota archaeon]